MTSESSPASKGKILIVDDAPDNLQFLSTALEKHGYEVQCAASGELALIEVNAAAPDLVLLDICMSCMDGYEVCQRLKASDRTRDIPIIFLSALNEVDDKLRAFQAGGADYLTHPVQVEELLVRVENQLALRRAQRQIEDMNAKLEEWVRERTAQLEVANRHLQQEVCDRLRAEAAQQESEERLRRAIVHAPFPILIHAEDGEVIQVNDTWQELTGYTHREIATVAQWTSLAYGERATAIKAQIDSLYDLDGKVAEGEFEIATRYGEKRIWSFSSAPLGTLPDGRRTVISMAMDVTDRRRAEEQLRHDALHDALTGLANRTLLMERIEVALRRLKRHGELFAVLFMDVDRFKVVNDSLGHLTGDEMLVAIARRLEEVVRSLDTVARLGGDEFVILLDWLDRDSDAFRIAERILEAFKTPFAIAGRDILMTASIGIVMGSDGYNRASDLLRDADIAMYRAKEKGKARYEVFDRAMHAKALQQLQLESELQQALNADEFVVHYHPIVSLTTGSLTGFEALVRWQHPVRGLVPPNEFIPIAEETGCIVPIGAWVLREACTQMKTWQEKFPTLVAATMSVNLSVKQLREEHLMDTVDGILAETRLPGRCLRLEITESMLAQDVEGAIALLTQLRQREIHLSIDDFGTGYSSLSYLQHFPITMLKIDRSFVSRIGEQGENVAIIRAIVNLAHHLGMEAIAEGVETPQQLDRLRSLQCEFGQGFFFSRPLPAHAAEMAIAAFRT